MRKLLTFVLAAGAALFALQSCGGKKEVKISDDPQENARIYVESMIDYAGGGDSIAFDNVLRQLCDKYESAPYEEMITFGIASQQRMSALSPEDMRKLSDRLPQMVRMEQFRRFQSLGTSQHESNGAADPGVTPADTLADYSDIADN